MLVDDRSRPALAIDSILHPSDFSAASQLAFVHALKLALLGQARLTIFHASGDPEQRSVRWRDFPGVRETLERWGKLPPGSPRGAVAKLGLSVEKIAAHEGDPLDAILSYVRTHPPQLIVLATHGRDGPSRWLHTAFAEPLARKARTMTLFVPQRARGFVAEEDGSAELDRVLVPIDTAPRAQPAVTVAAAFARAFRREKTRFALLHANGNGDAPAVHVPDDPGWSWERVEAERRPVSAILGAVERFRPNLIVMTTRGPEGMIDGLRGTTTERVLRRARCPVLAIPES